MEVVELQRNVTRLGNALGVGDGFRKVFEEDGHLLGAFEIERIVLHLEARFIVNRGVGVYADTQVLEDGVLLVGVVAVVGGHERDVHIPVHGNQGLVDVLQAWDVPVLLYLQIEAVLEDLPVPLCPVGGVFNPPLGD